jgi:HK97 family phage major capsid protein
VDPVDLDEHRSVEELIDVRKTLTGRLNELDSEFAGQPMSETARNEFAGVKKTLDDLEARVKEFEARKKTLERYGEEPARVERVDDAFFSEGRATLKERDIYDLSRDEYRVDPYNPEKSRMGLRDGAMRAIELAKFPYLGAKGQQVNREDCQSHIERLVETAQGPPGEMARHLLVTGSPLYRQAFRKAISSTLGLGGAGLSREEQRALGLGATVGGQAVPFTLDPTVIPTSNSVVNPARALGRNETLVGSNTWNGISSGAITASRAAEAAVTTDNSPTMAAPTATVTKAQAFVPFSVEIEEDWVGMENELAMLFQDAKDDEEATAFVTGAGSGVNPQGFVTGATVTFAAPSGLTITALSLYNFEAALPPRFRPNESFVANRGIYNVVRGIDTAGGAALWLYVSQGLVTQSPTPGNTGATLLGRGAWEASQMQATIVNATKIAVVGDFNYFLILDRIGLHIELIPFLFGAGQGNQPVGQRGVYAWWRNTSKVLSASAFVAMTGTT